MARLSFRIVFDSSGRAVGPGMAELLEHISETGSIRKAAAAMGMSYRKAWLLIQGMQKTFGGAVVATTTGGVRGGGAVLTPLGTGVLSAYRRMEKRLNRAAKADLDVLAAFSRPTRNSSLSKRPR